MAPATDWLSFSLSPMEMLRSSESQFMSSAYESSATASLHYLIDNFYADGWANPREAPAVNSAMADTSILITSLKNPETQQQVPKLEDFLGDSSSSVNLRYSDHSQTETGQDSSSLTDIYDRHQDSAAYFSSEQQDLKAIPSFQALSANSGSEVDDSVSITRTRLAGGVSDQLIDQSTGKEAGFGVNKAALSLGVNDDDNDADDTSSNQLGSGEKLTIVSADSGFSKKIADTFGQRTSIYRGVTRHRWTGRYEAHLWDNSCRREGQARKGRQVYLGGYDKEEKAARAYDLAALKYRGPTATTNFPVPKYTKELEDMKYVSKQEFIASLRRHHQQGRWQARIGRVAGNKDLYLGTFATEEEAAEAYDIAAIKFRGLNAVTNFEMSRYDVEAIMKSALPLGGVAKRLKLSLDAEKKLNVNHDQQSHCGSNGDNNNISFAAVQPVSAAISRGVPFDASAVLYHHNLYHHLQTTTNFGATDSPGSISSLATPMIVLPQTVEFFVWPHQTY